MTRTTVKMSTIVGQLFTMTRTTVKMSTIVSQLFTMTRSTVKMSTFVGQISQLEIAIKQAFKEEQMALHQNRFSRTT